MVAAQVEARNDQKEHGKLPHDEDRFAHDQSKQRAQETWAMSSRSR